jgi:hypothetical protein
MLQDRMLRPRVTRKECRLTRSRCDLGSGDLPRGARPSFRRQAATSVRRRSAPVLPIQIATDISFHFLVMGEATMSAVHLPAKNSSSDGGIRTIFEPLCLGQRPCHLRDCKTTDKRSCRPAASTCGAMTARGFRARNANRQDASKTVDRAEYACSHVELSQSI